MDRDRLGHADLRHHRFGRNRVICARDAGAEMDGHGQVEVDAGFPEAISNSGLVIFSSPSGSPVSASTCAANPAARRTGTWIGKGRILRPPYCPRRAASFSIRVDWSMSCVGSRNADQVLGIVAAEIRQPAIYRR